MRRIALIASLAATEALAHPGHGARGWISAEVAHLLGEPDHLALILAPLALAATGIGAWRRRRAERRICPDRDKLPGG